MRERIARHELPKRGSWGPWYFDPKMIVLVHMDGYEIDLEKCDTSAEILDWLAQLRGKSWVTPTDLGNLMIAFDDLFHVQANFCSWGKERNPNPVEVLRENKWLPSVP